MNVISEISLWFLLPWLGFSFFLAYLFYRKSGWKNEISAVLRYTLTSIRALSLFLIGLMLLGILLEDKQINKENPLVLTLLDNSESLLNYSDSSQVESEITNYISDLNKSTKEVDHLVMDFNGQIDEIDFKHSTSPISQLFQSAFDNYYGRNIAQINLISDGNFNSGENPLMTIEKLGNIPINVLAVGDTIQKKDLLIQNIYHNKVSFLNNLTQVKVTVEAQLANENKVKVNLYKKDKIIASKPLSLSSQEYQSHDLFFEINTNEIGINTYTVEVEGIPDESNYQNNKESFYIEVLDDRSQIVVLSDGPHPDIAALKSVLDKEENIEFNTLYFKDINNLDSSVDLLIILLGENLLSKQTIDKITSLKCSKLYLVGSNVQQENIRILAPEMNVNLRKGNFDEIGAVVNSDFNAINFSEKMKNYLSSCPPLSVPYGPFQHHPNSEILAYQKLGPVQKKEPIIWFSKQDFKTGFIWGEGIWRWKFFDYAENQNHDLFDELIKKSTQYLMVKNNTSRFKIDYPKLITSQNDIVFEAFVFNKIFEPVTDADIKLNVENENEEVLNFNFLNENLNYSVNLGRLPKGKYSWKAEANWNGEKFEKIGEFTLAKLSIEDKDTKANHQLLNAIAQKTSGDFFLLKDYGSLINAVNKSKGFSPVAYESTSYKQLIAYYWPIVVLIILLISEWILRRRNGAY